MKNTVLWFVILFALLSCQDIMAQEKKENPMDKLKKYYFVMLKKGNNRGHDSVTVAQLQAGHMAHIHRMAEAGKLQVAGPFADNGDWRGIFIFDVATEAEVIELLKDDPAISSGRLSYEIHPWYTEKGTCFK